MGGSAPSRWQMRSSRGDVRPLVCRDCCRSGLPRASSQETARREDLRRSQRAQGHLVGESISISSSNFPKSLVFAKQPKLVRNGTAAAVAETAAATLAGHEAARRMDLEMAAAVFDKALELDLLAEGRAKGASRAPGLLPRLATNCGEAIVTAFDPRTREYTGSESGCWLLLRSAKGPRCTCRGEAGV